MSVRTVQSQYEKASSGASIVFEEFFFSWKACMSWWMHHQLTFYIQLKKWNHISLQLRNKSTELYHQLLHSATMSTCYTKTRKMLPFVCHIIEMNPVKTAARVVGGLSLDWTCSLWCFKGVVCLPGSSDASSYSSSLELLWKAKKATTCGCENWRTCKYKYWWV